MKAKQRPRPTRTNAKRERYFGCDTRRRIKITVFRLIINGLSLYSQYQLSGIVSDCERRCIDRKIGVFGWAYLNSVHSRIAVDELPPKSNPNAVQNEQHMQPDRVGYTQRVNESNVSIGKSRNQQHGIRNNKIKQKINTSSLSVLIKSRVHIKWIKKCKQYKWNWWRHRNPLAEPSLQCMCFFCVDGKHEQPN